MKILIADDSRVMRQIVTRTLRQAGFDGHDLVEAADGKQAYDLAVAEGPDLVISDWNMPVWRCCASCAPPATTSASAS